MCGVVGIFDARREGRANRSRIAAMTAALAHRGPDQKGLYLDDRIGLGHARLSIIDLTTGAQPIGNETGTAWVVLNGEIYNYVELKARLEAKGHRFATTTDTEVLLHLYEELDLACVEELNGQFAFGIWDTVRQRLVLGRDRFGICPLYYATPPGAFLFASEIKGLLASGLLPPPELDPRALDQAFTFWTTLPGATAFRGIFELEPGNVMAIDANGRALRRYWDIPFVSPDSYVRRRPETVAEDALSLLTDATRIRLRADVPVGSYLSGGIDSSGITSLIARHFKRDVRTFGVRFEEEAFDEGAYQEEMAASLGVEHRALLATNAAIAESFPAVVRHCETPILRTAPAPMFLLSRFVHGRGIKVVCTGEGADEVFGGYDIHREALVRRFALRHPGSRIRPRLFERLYPQIFRTSREQASLREFLGRGPEDPGEPFFSHALRWSNTARIKQFFSGDLRAVLGGYSATAELAGSLPPGFRDRDVLAKAMYLEDKLFLRGYLLTSQGDRMAMAHGVEIRPPYLDHRIFDLMAGVPPHWKISGLDEKHLLKMAFKEILPSSITARTKHPYRAPIQRAFSGRLGGEAFERALSSRAVRELGFFDPEKVGRLLRKVESGESRNETEGMAFAGILSTQFLALDLAGAGPAKTASEMRWDVLVDRRTGRDS